MERSRDHEAVVKRSLAAGARGDDEAAMAMFSPGVVAHYSASLPFGGDHRGLPAYLEVLRELNRLFHLEVAKAEVVGVEGDRVLLFLNVAYTEPVSGRKVSQPSVEVLTFTGGQVTDVAVYHQDAAALTALLRNG